MRLTCVCVSIHIVQICFSKVGVILHKPRKYNLYICVVSFIWESEVCDEISCLFHDDINYSSIRVLILNERFNSYARRRWRWRWRRRWHCQRSKLNSSGGWWEWRGERGEWRYGVEEQSFMHTHFIHNSLMHAFRSAHTTLSSHVRRGSVARSRSFDGSENVLVVIWVAKWENTSTQNENHHKWS